MIAERLQNTNVIRHVLPDLGKRRQVCQGLGRTRIGGIARWELESCVATSSNMTGPPDDLTFAKYERPDKVRLLFADGLSGVWSFHQLELNMEDTRPATIRAGASGTDLEVKSKHGETMQIDSSSLRAMIDPEYAANLEKSLGGLSNDELRALESRPPQRWYDEANDVF